LRNLPPAGGKRKEEEEEEEGKNQTQNKGKNYLIFGHKN